MIRKTDEKSFFPAQLKVQTRILPGRPQTAAPVAGSWQGRDPGLRELNRYLQKGQESPQTEVLSSSAASLSARAGTVPHLRLASPTCLPVWGSSPPSRPPCGPGPLPRQALGEGTVRLAPGRGGARHPQGGDGQRPCTQAPLRLAAGPPGQAAPRRPPLAGSGPEAGGDAPTSAAHTCTDVSANAPAETPALVTLPERAGTVRGASVDDPRRFSGSASGDRCGEAPRRPIRRAWRVPGWGANPDPRNARTEVAPSPRAPRALPRALSLIARPVILFSSSFYFVVDKNKHDCRIIKLRTKRALVSALRKDLE